MTKNTKIGIGVAAVIVVIIALYFYFKEPDVEAMPDAAQTSNASVGSTPATTTTTVTNDDFPLVKGSHGDRVKSVQRALNNINPSLKLAVDGALGNDTYTGIITYVGTKYYPVTAQNFMTIIQKSQVK